MSIPVLKGILSLLLLAWPSTELPHQSQHGIDVSIGSNLTLHCMPDSPDTELVWCSTLNKKKEGKMVEEDTETHLQEKNGSYNLTFTSINEKHAGNYTCNMKIPYCVDVRRKNCPCKSCKATYTYGRGFRSQPKTSAIVLCRFMVQPENETMLVRWWTFPELHGYPSGYCKNAASAEATMCNVSSSSFTGTENASQGMAPSPDPEMSPTREPQMHKDLIAIAYTYGIPSLVVVTLLFLLCILVCLCRRKQRNAKGTPESKHAAEVNQLSTPPPASQAEDVTYAKLIFDKAGSVPAASEVVYTEIKPLQKS
ncbi:uncharacterized protein [Excalfactoria chinensis]|uniref:uncharacterized protein n=1 Tax=Excalfactoria chinensis TaxID=46218 RepID=UPI003B3B007F